MTSTQRPQTKSNATQITPSRDTTAPVSVTELPLQHFRYGWWSLLIFVGLGAALESLHAFKVPGYLNVGHETRRLMWTLTHAHGTLLALVQIAFATTITWVGAPQSRRLSCASRCLTYSAILIPLGFFLGGLDFHGGDPGIGIILVPIGAALLLLALSLTACLLHQNPITKIN